jgi:hypothetical protein
MGTNISKKHAASTVSVENSFILKTKDNYLHPNIILPTMLMSPTCSLPYAIIDTISHAIFNLSSAYCVPAISLDSTGKVKLSPFQAVEAYRVVRC